MKALITGANKGIGFALAQNLGRRGYEILVGARDQTRGDLAVSQLSDQGITASFIKVDLNDLATITRAADSVKDLDLLIANAGIPGASFRRRNPDQPLLPANELDNTVEDLREVLDVNFLGNFQLIQSFAPQLDSSSGKFLAVTIPISGSPFWNPLTYKTSKAALNVAIQVLGIDNTQHGRKFEIFGVMPGAVSTDLNGHTQIPGVKTPDEAAETITSFLFDGINHNGHLINWTGLEISSYEPEDMLVSGLDSD